MSTCADIEVERCDDIIQHVVKNILSNHQSLLPDLQTIKVIFPNSNVCSAFRKVLLAQLPQSVSGILPPWAGTLDEYLHSFLPTRVDTRIISAEARRLLFIETLDAHPTLFNDENKWQITTLLLSLFDELYLANPDILDASEDDWLSYLQSAYHIEKNYPGLRHEATLIQTLWLAWQDQLAANQMTDPVRHYVSELATFSPESTDDFIYVVTTTTYTSVEKSFFERLKNNYRCCIFEFDITNAGRNTFEKFINYAFDTESSLRERSQLYRNELKDLELPYTYFPADSDESEACAAELQVRKWLLEGKTNLGIVCENRKLSRRIRALLERANVPLQDLSGWSLATTSAAAVLESWLQCVEENFNHKVFLDVLKSHFFLPDTEIEFHKQAVYRLEHDIILNENISSDLARYKKQLKIRADKLGHWPDRTYTYIDQLIADINSISLPLLELYQSKKKHTLSTHLDALSDSLEQLSITNAFHTDDAGQVILNVLSQMKSGLEHANPNMLWSDFRIWLGINMETTLFKPQTSSSAVALLSLNQTELMRFDALIIAATDKQHFPGTADSSPFFNQSVRKELQLSDWQHQREQRLTLFKNLLFSSKQILITYKSKDKGEAIPLSPWVSAMQQGYRSISDKPIFDSLLIKTLRSEKHQINFDTGALPALSSRPSTAIPSDLMPDKLSASAHQSLMNCPYLYFASYALSLKPSEEISDELQKSDYGRLIHRVLQAFHLPSDDRLEPFKHEITTHNRLDAISHLNQISEQLFQRDLESNALHKSWLYRWQKQIPSYIDWQIKQQKDWHVVSTEQQLNCELSHEKTLYGRIDRIDSNNDHKSIIDYKTGQSANQDEVDSAEDVQLITYALLDDDVDNVFYLNLDNNKGVKQGASISGDELLSLKNAGKTRLVDIIQMTHEGKRYSAWGSEKVCSYCNYIGICRKPFWDTQ